jgi:hypothetical protein
MNNHIKHLPNGDFKVEPLTEENEKIMNDQMDKLTEASQLIAKEMDAARIMQDVEAGFFWDSLSYEDKCNAFHAVVSKIVEGEIKVKGSYRYVLYDIFGFGPEMYIRGMNCGFMALHNSIVDGESNDPI